MSIEIVTLDVQPPDETATVALRLLCSEVFDNDLPNAPAWYLATPGAQNLTLYGALDTHGEVLGAAGVVHDKKIWWHKVTEVQSLAVRRDVRRQGIGSAIMRHIAAQALSAENDRIQLVALKPRFYENRGFKNKNRRMRAKPEDVLNS